MDRLVRMSDGRCGRRVREGEPPSASRTISRSACVHLAVGESKTDQFAYAQPCGVRGYQTRSALQVGGSRGNAFEFLGAQDLGKQVRLTSGRGGTSSVGTSSRAAPRSLAVDRRRMLHGPGYAIG